MVLFSHLFFLFIFLRLESDSVVLAFTRICIFFILSMPSLCLFIDKCR